MATPQLLRLLGVAPALRPPAASYVRLRGLVAWAALMQSVALSGLLAAKDSVTPLKAPVGLVHIGYAICICLYIGSRDGNRCISDIYLVSYICDICSSMVESSIYMIYIIYTV